MAERVTITIDVDAKTAEIGKTLASIKALDSAVNRLDKKTKRLSGSMSAQSKALKNVNQNLDDFHNKLHKSYTRANRFSSIARLLMFTLIGLGIEFAAVALSLVSVNAAFNIGKLAVKGYHAVMGGLTATVAAIGVGLATVAAAQREYNASLYAYRMKSFPALGKGLNQSMAMLRNLTTDATMASFGVQALNQAFMSVSKNSEFTGRSLQVLRALSDFAYAGGDPAANIAAAAEFVGILQKEGKVTSQVTAAAKAMGPEFEKSFKKLSKGKTAASDVFGLITSGALAKDAGVLGQAGVVNDTLMGTFNAFKTRMVAIFADFGKQFLEPFRKALLTIEGLFRRTFEKVGPELRKFGQGPLLRFITEGAAKVLDVSITLFRKYLPLLDGFGSKVIKFGHDFMRSFRQLRDALEPLRDGGSIVIKMFGKPIMEVFKGLGRNVKSFAKMAEDNKPEFLAFGESLKNLVASIMEFANAFKEAFTNALPVIRRIIDGLSMVVGLFTKILKAVSSLGTMGAFAAVGGLAFAGMKGRRSAQIRSGRRPINEAAMANQQFYAISGANKLPLLPRRSAQGTAMAGQLGMDPSSILFGGGYEKISLKEMKQLYADYADDVRSGKISGRVPSKSAPYKAYMRQRLNIAGFGAGIAMAELGPRIFGKESSTAMQIGGAIAPFSMPLGAGVGLLGAGMSARTQAGGMGLGAAGGGIAGAKLGAMLGSVVPGLGTLGGAIGGALIGAVAGGFIGSIKGGRAERKLSKQIGTQVQDLVLRGVAGSLVTGDTASARQLIAGFSADAKRYAGGDDETRKRMIDSFVGRGMISASDAEKAKKHLDNFGKGIKDLESNLDKAMKGPMKNFDELIKGLGSASGKSKDEIVELARRMNVNLYDETMTLQQAIASLGIGMVKTKDQINAAMRDILINSTSVFQEIRDLDDAVSALADAGEKFRTGEIADFTKSDFLDLMETNVSYLNAQFPNDPIANLGAFISMYGPGGSSFTGLGPLGRPGTEAQFAKVGGRDAYNRYVRTSISGLSGEAIGGIGAQLASAGLRFSDPKMLETLTSRLGSMDPQAALEIIKTLSSTNIKTQFGAYRSGVASPLLNFMQSLGLDMSGIGIVKSSAGLNTVTDPSLQPLQESIISAINVGFDEKPEWWEDFPVWWQNPGAPGQLDRRADPDGNGIPGYQGDTATSRLQRTMGKHAYFNSRLTGKRSVTSSLRNFNLGSPSSDHATGNAYDLTGQNLGMYATMIKGAGGFAEFHGYGASRHLHVVPPTGPMGDRSNPVSVAPASQSGSSSAGSGPITVNVYGSENQNVRELARVVIDELNKVQRSSRERR